jgi:hypothetical protein
MKNITLLFLLLFSLNLFAQSDTLNFDNYYLTLRDGLLEVSGNDGQLFYHKEFMNPSFYTYDLNDDGNDEFLILDSTTNNDKPSYTLYIFSTVNSFSFIDSIISGAMEPFETNSEDIGGTIIVTGNTDFNQFDQNDENYFLPINCWRYDDSAIFLVNGEVYKAFINENDNILNFLDDYFSGNTKDCSASTFLKGAIAAAYANYLNAGEKSIASQFLKNYYLCEDIDQFKQKLNELIKGSE